MALHLNGKGYVLRNLFSSWNTPDDILVRKSIWTAL